MKNRHVEIATTNIGIIWIVTNAISWCLGFAIGFLLELKIYFFVSDLSHNLLGISDLFSNLISATVLGFTIGLGQTLVFRRWNRTIDLQWTKSTLLGIVIATFFVNVSGSHTFYPMDCFICFGGINMPSQRFTFGNPFTSGVIGLEISASQYYFHKKLDFLTAKWIVWSTIGFILALIGGYIVSVFAADLLTVGITQGALYGLLTVRPITRQLKKYDKITQEIQVEAA